MNNTLRLAKHEWHLVLRDPRFLLPFLFAPCLLILLHGISLYFIPGQASEHWALSRSFLLLLSWLGSAMAIPLGADAFAGEKERQTWETLICLPLSSGQLFLGKVLGILPFPWMVGWCGQTLVLLLARINGGLGNSRPMEWITPLLLTPTLSLFFCSLSVLISLHVETMRSAAQWTGLILLCFGPLLAIASQIWFQEMASMAMVLSFLVLSSLFCLGIAKRRLHRVRESV